MPVANPVTSSQPGTQIPGSQPMGGLEIGLMAGSIVFFVVLISSIFIVRGLDQRRRIKEMLRRAEEGNPGVKGESQTSQEDDMPGPDQHEAAKHHLWGKMLTFGKQIVVERLSKNINEQHLYEIFGQYGRIKDLDLPINRTFGTNRGTAYILYDYAGDAESAIAHMHEAQVDGSAINVSIVLPRRKLSPAPPTARRGANIDPRVPFVGGRGGPPGAGIQGNNGTGGGGGRRRTSPGSRFGPRSDVYRPGSRSPSRSPVGPPARGGHDQDPQLPDAKEPVITMTTSQDAVAVSTVTKAEAGLAAGGTVPSERRVSRCKLIATAFVRTDVDHSEILGH
ncbi:hypothetical protein KAF25_008456 [Fusarium avenaceum]|uniref:RRM domain-containing protein n=1 Tax=Fusarium avenaceum TaxID=40199 RepID=A0A9P7HH77_9HYPO|nr:hypothetical protein KAF25_008456 [Fusarium avenaceum]